MRGGTPPQPAAKEGFGDRGSKRPERIGALAGLLDYRDGTNYTGLNPEHRHYLRHIDITGHQSSPVLMRALRRRHAAGGAQRQ